MSNHDEVLLREAALAGDLETVNMLVTQGTPINTVDSYNNTALLNAARRGRMECVRYLVSNGADVNLPNMSGNSPLLFSVRRGAIEEVRLLLSLVANINQQVRDEDTPGWYTTPLKAAMSRGLHPIIELLEKYNKPNK